MTFTPVASTTILAALFNLLISTEAFPSNGQRLKFWSDDAEQPALYTRWTHDEYPPYEVRGAPPIVTMHVEVWLYGRQLNVDGNTTDVLGPLVDTVRAVIRPVVPRVVQDLGMPGIIEHCWIEGRVQYDTGDHSGQVVAIIPVRIKVKGILG